MKFINNYKIIIVAIAFVGTATIACAYHRAAGRPRAEVVQAYVHDFGRMSTAHRGRRTWTMRNVGTAPLHVWLAKPPGCGCAVASFWRNVRESIAPGGLREVSFEWGSGMPVANYSQSFEIATSDADHPVFTLGVEGEIVAPVAISPAVVNLGIFPAKRGASTIVEVSSGDRLGTRVLGVASSRPGALSAEVEGPSGSAYRIIVMIRAGMPLGPFREAITIRTDHPDQPEMTLAVSGTPSGTIRTIPAGILLRDGRESSIALIVSDGRPTSFRVADRPTLADYVEVRPDGGDGRTGRYRLISKGAAGLSGPPDGPIVLKTDHPEMPLVEVPVFAAAR